MLLSCKNSFIRFARIRFFESIKSIMNENSVLLLRRSLLLRGITSSMMASLVLLSIVKASAPSRESSSESIHVAEFPPENDYPVFDYEPESFT